MPTGEWADVYEPVEDTHLLMDCLSSQADFLRQLGPRGPAVCAEVGCGSGVVIVHLAALCPSALCVATDVNPAALAHTARHARDAGVGARVAPVRTDVAAALLPRLKGAVDVLVFNPPYVLTPSDEIPTDLHGAGISAAWAGGVDGREVTDRALPQLAALLSPRGAMYIIAVRENRPKQLAELAKREHQLSCRVLCRRDAGEEHLMVLKFWKPAP